MIGRSLQPCPITGLAINAWDAIDRFKEAIESHEHLRNIPVLAAGIDAPVRWNKAGSRKADDTLRKALRETGFPKSKVNGTVQAVNSLQGSCVVQGTLLARHLSEDEDWDLEITESHPTVFHRLVTSAEPSDLAKTVEQLTATFVTCERSRKRGAKLCTDCKPQSHERDATLCAVAAWTSLEQPSVPKRKWQNLYSGDLNLNYPSDIPCGYWMPIPC